MAALQRKPQGKMGQIFIVVGALAGVVITVLAVLAQHPNGRQLYAKTCASCHGAAMEGSSAPPLKGRPFKLRWEGRPIADLTSTIARMPANAPGSLSRSAAAALLSLILETNGYAASQPVLRSAEGVALQPNISLPGTPVQQGRPTGTLPTQSELLASANGDWLMYNRDYKGQRYSPLAQINRGNVSRLVRSCTLELAEIGSFQSSPLAYRGRLYVTTPSGTYAVDGRTCRLVWQHHYVAQGPEGLANSRGAALYQGRIIRGMPDGHLIALDANTGAPLWDVQVADGGKNYSLSAAVVAYDGRVYTGVAGGDYGATGHVYAFDAATGQHVWTFDVIPTGTQPGARSWNNGQWVGGGGSWSTITVDPMDRLILVPVGNPGSDLDGRPRPGINLFTNSVVALRPNNGGLAWYVQQIPHDTHDWNTAAAPVIYERAGRRFMAVPSKDGWLYLYDRDTRALLARKETTTLLNSEIEPSSKPTRICPGTLGGTEWNGAGYDPMRGRLFVGSVDWCGTYIRQSGKDRNAFGGRVIFDPSEKARGWLRAFDAATGRPLWTYHADAPMIAGITPTAGGVVFTGSGNGDFLAFDSMTGKILYKFKTGGAIGGGVSSYAVGGRQYVVVASGNASRTIWRTQGRATLVVFALPN